MKSIGALLFLKSLLLINMPAIADTNDLIPIGNFALPVSLQPSPLFSFGQFIINADDKILFVNPIYLKGKNKSSFENETILLYGLSDNASIFGLLPAPVLNDENGVETANFGDILIEYEYAFINATRVYDEIQSTIVASIFLPTGILELEREGEAEPDIESQSGFGSTSFLLGWTCSYMSVDWYTFVSAGGVLTTSRKDKTKLGDSVLYQAGIGRNLKHLDRKILLLLFEMDGIYSKRDQILGIINPNSGGNVIWFGPSLYYSDPRFIFQIGIQVPIYQKLNGIQTKDNYLFSVSFAWLFNDENP